MDEYENKNSMAHDNENKGDAQGSPMGSDPYSYQSGYYRGGAQQDSNFNYASGGNNYSGASDSSSSGAAGYSYVNYYQNSGDGSGSDGKPPKKQKKQKKQKKHTALKVIGFIVAMVIVAGASIGIYEGVRTTMEADDADDDDTKVVETVEKSSGDSDNNNSDTSSTSAAGGDSWIELAAGEDALSVSEIVEKVTPSVVGVTALFVTEVTNDNTYGDYFGWFFDYGYGGEGNTTTQQATGVGTGIIMSEDGYIVTNAHVIYDDEYGYGEAQAVQIQMSDEETIYDADIVAYDQEADIAVLHIDADGLVAAEFGDSSELKVGDMVVAIGNPLGLEFQNTVTCGIVSALNRQVTINDNTMTLIQTDTAINSGNSGGPLINSAGQVIGINSAKMSSSYSSSSASIEGIGFAIPMTEASIIINDLISYGYVTGRPQLGITCQDVSASVSQAYNIPIGAYIISVTEGGAADQAGLQPADVIIAIEGTEIETTEELNNIKNEYNAGDTVVLTVVRAGEELEIPVVLEEVTADN